MRASIEAEVSEEKRLLLNEGRHSVSEGFGKEFFSEDVAASH